MNPPNPIIEKIKKLLALAADSGATEGERDNAIRMAHGLLAKHNLDMAQVTASQQIEGREKYQNDTWGMLWCRQVSQHIAKLFFCKYYFGQKINGTRMQHFFVGKTSNVATAALMADFIIHSILKECRSNGWHNLSPEARSFATGAVRVIGERVVALIKNPEGEATGTGLMVQSLYKTEAEAHDAFIKAAGTELVTKPVRSGHLDGRTYAMGKSFGAKVGLDVQVGNKNTLRIGK